MATPAGAASHTAVDWHSINWKKVHRTVRRLQARIVKAVREGQWHKVKALVYLLTHSFSGRALAILRVVSNSGAKTPGVEGTLWNTPVVQSAAFSALRRHGYQPLPLRRVYLPKSNGKRRPLERLKKLPKFRKTSEVWLVILGSLSAAGLAQIGMRPYPRSRSRRSKGPHRYAKVDVGIRRLVGDQLE